MNGSFFFSFFHSSHSFYFIVQDFLSVAHYDHISLLLSRMLYSLENQSGSEWRRLTSSRQMKTFLFRQSTMAKIIKFCPNIMMHFCLLNYQNAYLKHKNFTAKLRGIRTWSRSADLIDMRFELGPKNLRYVLGFLHRFLGHCTVRTPI